MTLHEQIEAEWLQNIPDTLDHVRQRRGKWGRAAREFLIRFGQEILIETNRRKGRHLYVRVTGNWVVDKFQVKECARLILKNLGYPTKKTERYELVLKNLYEQYDFLTEGAQFSPLLARVYDQIQARQAVRNPTTGKIEYQLELKGDSERINPTHSMDQYIKDSETLEAMVEQTLVVLSQSIVRSPRSADRVLTDDIWEAWAEIHGSTLDEDEIAGYSRRKVMQRIRKSAGIPHPILLSVGGRGHRHSCCGWRGYRFLYSERQAA